MTDVPIPALMPEGCMVDVEDFGDGPTMTFRTPLGTLVASMSGSSYLAILERCRGTEQAARARKALVKMGALPPEPKSQQQREAPEPDANPSDGLADHGGGDDDGAAEDGEGDQHAESVPQKPQGRTER